MTMPKTEVLALLYELSKKDPKGLDDAYLLERIDHIRLTINSEKDLAARRKYGRKSSQTDADSLAAACTGFLSSARKIAHPVISVTSVK